jgi:TPP-dependent pyruvate/acetoin dehydrogenase alpha subunit
MSAQITPTNLAYPGMRWPSLDDEVPGDAMALLRMMLVIRQFEDGVQTIFEQGLMRGSAHLYTGQEAVAVGVCTALRPGDTMTCTYRGHGAVIAMGAPLDRCFGEILGKSSGICRGKGGSMHLTDVSVGALGSNAIVGGHLPTTLGAAFAADYLGTGAVSVAFFGDGAINIGAFHETLNMAAVWKVPAIFILENNQYGEYSPIAATTGILELARRADAYGMPGFKIDGNDVTAVRAATTWAAERARQGEGPSLIEADTYRHHGHSRSDPATYRPAEEVERWMALDPIPRLAVAAIRRGLTNESTIEQLRAEVVAEVKEALDRAMSWPAPHESELLEGIFS